MQRIKILMRMLRNRFLSGDATLRSDHRPWLDRAVFVLNFFPPYNWTCSLWALFCGRCVPNSTSAAIISWALMKRDFLFGALRHLSPEDRTAFASAVVLPRARKNHRPPLISEEARALATEIGRTGFANLGQQISREEARSAVGYFSQQSGYCSQTPLQSDGRRQQFDVAALKDQSADRYFCFSSKTSLMCPQVKAIIDNPMLREVAAGYLGFMPELFNVNTIATVSGESEHYVMRLHRDFDAFASITFFVYWTDVSANNGATLFVPGSHLSSKVDTSHLVPLSGGAGEIFGIDPFGLHAGNRSVDGLRLATWFRYGLKPNLATIQDPDLVPDSGVLVGA